MNDKTKTVEIEGFDKAGLAKLKKVAVPLKAALEDVINSAEISNVIACYDDGGVIVDAEEVASEAASFVLKGLIGSLCYNVIQGYTGNGAQMLNKALDDVDQAAARDEATPSQKTQEALHGRINWACRMDVQQSYRKVLQPWCEALYVAVIGERYPRPVARSGKTDSAEASVARSLRDRIAEREAS